MADIKTQWPTVNLLGIRFHPLSRRESLDAIETLLQNHKKSQIILANAYTVALCQRDVALREIINRGTLILADGMSIVWGGRWIGTRIPERVPGPDIMEALCRIAARKGYRIFLLGSTGQTLHRLGEKLLRLCPDLTISGSYSPAMCDKLSELENMKIFDALRQARADILFVGMSCPKQERWIAENLDRLPVTLSLGVGAAFDFLSGTVPRAPEWLRKYGFEWLYRLYREPRRLWKRYLLGNAVYLTALIKESLFPSNR